MIFVGLCESCAWHRWITSGRGSRFLFCDRSRVDPAFAKYPPLPVLACPGFERGTGAGGPGGGAPKSDPEPTP